MKQTLYKKFSEELITLAVLKFIRADTSPVYNQGVPDDLLQNTNYVPILH
jgi:hypothetical protein